MSKTQLLRGRANEKVSVFMSLELSNFCWSECQHTRKVCIFLFQAITLQNFSSFLDLKTNWLYNNLKNLEGLRNKGMTFVEFESHLRCWFDIIQFLFQFPACISRLFQNRSWNILKALCIKSAKDISNINLRWSYYFCNNKNCALHPNS